jgi:23S rRNA pseudouridine955/2504/2580 synthase
MLQNVTKCQENASFVMPEFIIAPADDDIRLDRWFKRYRPDIPHGLLSKLLRKGDIRLEGKKAEANTRVAQGQRLTIRDEAVPKRQENAPKQAYKVSEADAELMRSIVLFENNELFILNKPAGLAVQGGTGQSKSFDDMLFALGTRELGKPKLVHRLDQDTSGALAVAKTSKAAAKLAELFRHKEATKLYWALVVGCPLPPEGEIDLPMVKKVLGQHSRMESLTEKPQTRSRWSRRKPHGARMTLENGRPDLERIEKVRIDAEEGKDAKTRYKVIEDLGGKYAWVELEPITGRTHQLRVHMAAIGHPIVGDGKYGGRDAFIGGSMDISGKLHLHARSLALPGLAVVKAPLPPHMQKTWDTLGLD